MFRKRQFCRRVNSHGVHSLFRSGTPLNHMKHDGVCRQYRSPSWLTRSTIETVGANCDCTEIHAFPLNQSWRSFHKHSNPWIRYAEYAYSITLLHCNNLAQGRAQPNSPPSGCQLPNARSWLKKNLLVGECQLTVEGWSISLSERSKWRFVPIIPFTHRNRMQDLHQRV